jgi:hypothetical protein
MRQRTSRTIEIIACALIIGIVACRPAWADGGCERAIPDPGPDQIFTNLRTWEVDAFYRVLWSLRSYYYNNGNKPWRRRLDNLTGQYIDTTTAVRTCTKLGTKSAWSNSWICLADITGTFKLKDRTVDRLRVSGGGVTTIHEADGDAAQFTQTVGFLWDAPTHSLTVYVRYPASTIAQNHQRTWGTYSITALSKQRVRSTSGQSSSGLGYSPFGIWGSVETTESNTQTLIRATVTGNPYWADTGIVAYVQNVPEDTYLALQNHWLTDAYASIRTTVSRDVAACGTGSKFSYKFSGQGLVDSSGFSMNSLTGPAGQGSSGFVIEFAGADSTVCSASSEPLLAELTFRAANDFGECCTAPHVAPIANAVGQRYLARLRAINHKDGRCTRAYEVAFRAKVDWFLHFTAGSGDGTSFTLTSQNDDPTPPQDFAATVNCL